MASININLGERSYPIYFFNDYKNIGKCLQTAKINGKVVVVTDKNVDECQAEAFMKEIAETGLLVNKCIIEPGEQSKNLNTVKDIYKYLIELNLERNSALVALGGGVVGDITGFVAATFLRGIKFIQVPTSLLAQADSSVGGKVGVDFLGSKNIIGSFYQPSLVYINVNSLRTLPKRDLVSGLAEVIKHGIIRDAEFFEYMENNLEKIFSFDVAALQYMSKMNCQIKGRVVEEDEKETGLRAILNFGHTFGHAIESVSGFKLYHGECVSIGMVGAFKLAKYLNMIEQEHIERVQKLLAKANLPIKAEGLDIETVYNQMFYDKKIKNGKLVFILPKKIGQVFLCNVDDSGLVKQALRDII